MNFSNTEESFVLSSLNEFVKVWGSGGQSNLNLECRDGLACIKLSFNLGHPTSPHQNYPEYFSPAQNPLNPARRRNGPARQLKNTERAKAHKARIVAAAAAANQTVTDVSPVISATNVSASPSTSPPPAPALAPPPPPASPPHPVTTSPVRDPGADNSASTTTTSFPVAVTAAVNISTTAEAAPASQPPPATHSDITGPVPVYCIATFENCPDEELTQDYADSLRRYLASEDHLCHNISSAEFKHVSTRRLGSRFVHTVEVILDVKIERLWDNPATYIRKHLGASNEWSRGNGTLIKLSRIHQK